MDSFTDNICSIAKDFSESSDKSMFQLVKERFAKQSKPSINKENINECLKQNPEYIKNWLLYSENIRSSTGWYLKESTNSWVIGYLNNGILENEKVFESKYEACAEYIVNEIGRILHLNRG